MSDIRALLQPPAPPDVFIPLPVVAPSVSAAVTDNLLCPHYLDFTISAGPLGQVIAEVATGVTWTEVNPSGVTVMEKANVVGPPSRVTNKYTSARQSALIRARPAPGYSGITAYASVGLVASTPGARLSGVGSFKVIRTLEGEGLYSCAGLLIPGGFAHEAYSTAFSKFTCVATLKLYRFKPTITLGAATPTADWTSPLFPATLVGARYEFSGVLPPDLGTDDWYATMGASWFSSDCSLCADTVHTYARVNNYPFVLKVL